MLELSGPWHERAGQQEAVGRMARACKGLDADELLLPQIDFWLIPEFDPVLLQGLVEIDAAG